jgi:deoxyhypusine synthase
MIYFHSYRTPPGEQGLIIDIVQDIRRLNDMSLKAKKAGMIVLGGGVCKHQIANAMLFVSAPRFIAFAYTRVWTDTRYSKRNGADYAVYINTGQEFDGSDSGARPDEAVSWGKLKAGSQSVKVSLNTLLLYRLSSPTVYGRCMPTRHSCFPFWSLALSLMQNNDDNIL